MLMVGVVVGGGGGGASTTVNYSHKVLGLIPQYPTSLSKMPNICCFCSLF